MLVQARNHCIFDSDSIGAIQLDNMKGKCQRLFRIPDYSSDAYGKSGASTNGCWLVTTTPNFCYDLGYFVRISEAIWSAIAVHAWSDCKIWSIFKPFNCWRFISSGRSVKGRSFLTILCTVLKTLQVESFWILLCLANDFSTGCMAALSTAFSAACSSRTLVNINRYQLILS